VAGSAFTDAAASSTLAREPDELLLQAVVKDALEVAALIVAGQGEALPRRTHISYLATELVQIVGVRSFQGDHLLGPTRGGCSPSPGRVKRLAAHVVRRQPTPNPPATTVVTAGGPP